MRNASVTIAIGLFCLLASCGAASAQVRTPSEAQLVTRMTNGSQQEKAATVAYIMTMAPQEVGPALSRALYDELDRMNSERRRRGALVRQGLTLDDFQGEYFLMLVRAVAGLGDPGSIPSLVGSVDSGMSAVNALATFAPKQVVPLLVDVAGARDIGGEGPSADEVVGALQALTAIMNSAQRTGMPAQLEAAVGQVARMRLRGALSMNAHQNLTAADVAGVIFHACGLAATTGDPELRSRVKRLAEDRKELAALGASQVRATDLAQMGCRAAAARIR